MGSCPDIDDPRRCQAKRSSGRPCRKWALKGSKFCARHGGRRSRTPVIIPPTVYSRFLSRTLKSMVEEQMQRPPGEQLQLFEELALIRHTALRTVMLYDKVVESAEEGKPNSKAEMMAAALMRDTLHEVQRMAEAAARVAAAGKDQMPAHAVRYVILQVVKIAYGIFGDDERMRAFETALTETIKVPGNGDERTDITPDDDAEDMDDTIPRT